MADQEPDGGQRGQAPSGEAPQGQPQPKKRGLKERPILVVGLVTVLLLAAIGGVLLWLHARNFESTDDAFVDSHIVRLAPQVAGRVTRVFAEDNQLVQAGQPLVVLDSADADTRVAQSRAQKAQAQAQTDQARAEIAVDQASLRQSQADADAAKAQADDAARDLARYRALQAADPAAVAQQQFDQAVARAKQTDDQWRSALRAAKAKAAQVNEARTQVTAGESQVAAAQSQLNDADINLSYDTLVAPIAGHVAQKSVAVGNYAQPGTQLMAVVPLEIWVTANFKETQLAHMRIGQPVDIHVDACPRDHITGHVNSIQYGAGQAFALLPPENATGNFVKVVQRVPVKILFDNPPPDCPLGPGMSVEPRVRVR